MKIYSLILLLSLTLSCSSSAKRLIPKLERRTLRIAKDFPGFYYQYCQQNVWYSKKKCKKGEWRVEKYDLRDETIRRKLINMGFLLKVRKR